ncbi:uncharacterized protein TM35_000172660 [Trypanosoma theileri]|uniref:SB domain-containing protein n=1 Tax=Trypanosoma theileri TaxID=67003 RepID=A0A1X0NUL1_9TRYP|nr:uncharacterized protein TM35_000172660 [Trypanosoma theileri]ORC88394.1 hypothetical protein TM35_000172660 [Trypanosoma theileri]
MIESTTAAPGKLDFEASLKHWSSPSNLIDIYKNHSSAYAVAGYLQEFLPHSMKYPAHINIVEKDKGRAISLCFLLRTFPKDRSTAYLVDVGVMIPHGFPASSPKCRVRIRDLNQKLTDNAFLDGFIVPLQRLTMLSNIQSPYPIIRIIEAVKREMEEDIYCFAKGAESYCNNKDSQNYSQGEGITTTVTLGSLDKPTYPIMKAKLPPLKGITTPSPVIINNKSRVRLLKEAAGAIFKLQLRQAKSYLDLREESFPLLCRLYKKREFMLQEVYEMRLVKNNLYQMYNLSERSLHKTESVRLIADSPEVHSTCIVPADELQARALELLGEIHASDDSLELLERSLKAGQLSCEEYVRRVSDVGREQFEARFLFGRVTEAVNRSATGTGPRLPQNTPRANAAQRHTGEPIKVPTKLENEEVLLREFPEVGTEMIKAVLNLANGSLSEARVQLKAMLS